MLLRVVGSRRKRWIVQADEQSNDKREHRDLERHGESH